MADDLRQFLDRQIALIEAKDLGGLLEQYHEDAMVLRLDASAHGRGELHDFFASYFELDPRITSVDGFAAAEDTFMYEATLSVGDEQERTYGSFVMRDGRAWRQVAGVFAVRTTA